MISVLILTKNEEQDLPGCLDSVAWSDDIHVFDSLSEDRTVEIARSRGAAVTQRGYGESKLAFGGDEAAHRNWGLRNIPFKHPWLFVIDADERMTPALIRAVNEAAMSPGRYAAFRVRRRDFFLGTWLEHVQTSPYYVRLFKPEKMRYERLINPVSIPDGPVADIAGYLDHYPFSKGIAHWIARHNGYSSFEAQQILRNREQGEPFSVLAALFERDFTRRRFHQKELFYRLPARPLVKFALLYLAKGGFLDGRAGLSYATLQAIYEYMIVLKTRELEGKAHGEEAASPRAKLPA
jgi:glycosyltransferase involved in cell wall biosynthesis